MNQKQIFVLSFFILLILIFLQLVGVFHLFLTPILWAVILTMVFYPLYERCLKWVKGRRNLASAMVTLFVVIVTTGPMVFFSGTLVKEVLQFYQDVGQWVSSGRYESLVGNLLHSPLRSVWEKILEKTSSLDIQIIPLLAKTAQSISQSIVNQIQSGAKNFLVFVINYWIAIFIFFFFLRDGEFLGRGLKDIFPMTLENKEKMFGRLSVTVSAVVRGLVVTAVVQAVLAGIAFLVLGVPFPVFLSFLVAFLAIVPIGGAVVVWLPSAIYLGLSGSWSKAIILFFWCALVVSTIDNIIKPLLIGDKTKIPTLFLFLAILGGLAYYGFIGVFLGPIFLSLFMTLIEIYRKEYKNT